MAEADRRRHGRHVVQASIPTTFIAGLADGGDLAKPGGRRGLRSAIAIKDVDRTALNAASYRRWKFTVMTDQTSSTGITNGHCIQLNNLQNQVLAWASRRQLQGDLATLNSQLRTVSDAQAAYQALVAQGNRIQAERLTFRQHAAAVVQGYRTQRRRPLSCSKTRTCNATSPCSIWRPSTPSWRPRPTITKPACSTPARDKAFLNQIISSQALGVVNNGAAPSHRQRTGDPGLASALAEMNADWQVLKGRLGFNNPDGYGTTVSLRAENYRILATTDGDSNWQQVLQQGRVRRPPATTPT